MCERERAEFSGSAGRFNARSRRLSHHEEILSRFKKLFHRDMTAEEKKVFFLVQVPSLPVKETTDR
jgi:hypothetical protein